jgi:hypothetical protein
MRIPHMVGQVIVTFAVAAVIIPLVVVAVPATKDPTMGLVAVACVFGGVFGVLRAVWPRPRM